jgi:ATP-dependent protease ClpP protease subunit
MNRLMIIIVVLFLALVAQANPLKLTAENTLVWRGPVTALKAAEMQIQLLDLSHRLPAGSTVYLVLDTPGGDVDAGIQFIGFTKGLPLKIKTVTVFAASMGFQIVQGLDERLIVPTGTLMSHRAYFSGVRGEVPGEMITRLTYWIKQLTRLDMIAASRMGLKLGDYQDLIRDEYWVDGADAVADKAADRVVLARCDESFQGTVDEVVGEFLNVPVMGTFSKCPLISAPLKIFLARNDIKNGDKALALAKKHIANKRLRVVTHSFLTK